MEEPCARKGRHGQSGDLLLCGWENRGSPRFIVVFYEAKQLSLIGKICTEVEPNAFCAIVLQPVIEPLVVAEIEPQLLQLPFHVPVSFRNKLERRILFLDSRDHISPVFRCRTLARATVPGLPENRAKNQHRHVASNAIALARDTHKGFDHRLSKAWLKGVQL